MIFLFSVIIPMAGSGSRAKTSMNKALVMINGKPLFMYAYELFKQFDCEIILVCKEDEIPIVKKYVDNNVIFALGGNTRASSVYNGLLKANYEYVLIHDAARPFCTKVLIERVLEMLKTKNACYVGVPVKDTIRDINRDTILHREDLIAAQTPQACRVEDLKMAYEIGFNNNIEFTDDISAIEKYTNIDVGVVMGNDFNFKVTTPYDILLADLIAKGEDFND